jgi:molecular chaperone GrpE
MVDVREEPAVRSTRRAAVRALLESLRRERADFLNYKRRVERERVLDGERARADAISRILPVLDDLDRALARVPDDLREHPWAQGVALGHRQLRTALSGLGLERIGEVGEPFDAAVHEAVHYEPAPGAEPPRVRAMLRPGYRLGGRLIRPAQVVVVGPGPAGTGRPPRRGRRRNDTRASGAEEAVVGQAGGRHGDD